jgi:hypothetical protein
MRPASTSGLTRRLTGALPPSLPATRVEALEFGGRFDVEAEDAGGERQFHFGGGLADSRENDLLRIGAGGQNALEFAGRNDVETGAAAGQRRRARRGWSWP